KENAQALNSALTITDKEGKNLMCVLIERSFSSSAGSETAHALFAIGPEEIGFLQNDIKSVSFFLADGKKYKADVSYLHQNLANQAECLKRKEQADSSSMEQFRKMASEASEKENYEMALSYIEQAIKINP